MTSSNTRRAVIYTRLSKDRTGAGVNVAQQEKECRELAARLGLDVIEPIRTDNDISAFKGGRRSKHRSGYEELLEDIRSGRAQAVIAWHTDRLHRSLDELGAYIRICGTDENAVPTYTVKGGDIDLSTSNGITIAQIFGSIAEGEVRHMIERQKAAKKRIREAGGWQGGPRPFGYVADGPSIKNGGTGRLAQVPQEADAIRDAFTKVLAGAGLITIAKEWNARGLRTPSEASCGGGRGWNHSAVRTVLLRSLNAGLITYKGKITGRAKCDPIVSEDTWRAARALITDPARRTTPGPKPRWLLSGVLVCGACGGTRFRVMRSGAKKVPTYGCATYSLRDDGKMHINGCVGRNAEHLDAYVEQLILEKLRQPGAARALADPGIDVAALDARRAALNAQLNEFAAQEGITPQQLAIVSKPKLAELDFVEQEMSRGLRGSPLAGFADSAPDPAELWEQLNIEERRAVAAVMLRVVVLRVRGNKKPPGWRAGMPHPFDDSGIRITSPDGTPWGK